MLDRVLLIDDDANLLAALQRQLRKNYDLTTAQGGKEAIDAIHDAAERKEQFAVALCDMRMPGMDGIETLARIKEISQETVRIMLTGNADQQTAIDAINKGSIFRFLTKPCGAEDLVAGLAAGVEQYNLITAERDLLEKTLAGSIKVLADVVAINDPLAHAQAARLREWVRVLTVEFKLPVRWQLDIAAMLLPIGQVSIPPELQAKKQSGATLSPTEQEVMAQAPAAARNLITNIPRLAKVAEIVYLQDRGYDGSGFPSDGPKGADIPFDARLLKILKDLAEEAGGGPPTAAVFSALERNPMQYDPVLLARIRTCLLDTVPKEAPPEVEVPVTVLRAGHLVLSDIRLTNGHLILAANTKLSPAQAERLRSLSKIYSFVEPVRVRV